MRKMWLLVVVGLSLAVGPAFAGRHSRSEKKADIQNSSPAVQPDAAQAPQSGSNDIDKSLDELLSKPVTAKPKDSDLLQGHAEADSANMDANMQASGTNSADGLKPLKPKVAPAEATVLKGSAILNGGRASAQQDPDKEDQELMIEWDRWRNRFLRAVQLQVQASINHPDFEEDTRPRFDPVTGYLLPRFPLGTEAWFYCEVTSDRRIKHLEITQSSGFPAYDRAVLEGVRALEGTSLLKYPQGSRRNLVSQEAGVRTSSTADFRYHRFGDVERYRTPAP